jgi:hypothetical protein
VPWGQVSSRIEVGGVTVFLVQARALPPTSAITRGTAGIVTLNLGSGPRQPTRVAFSLCRSPACRVTCDTRWHRLSASHMRPSHAIKCRLATVDNRRRRGTSVALFVNEMRESRI